MQAWAYVCSCMHVYTSMCAHVRPYIYYINVYIHVYIYIYIFWSTCTPDCLVIHKVYIYIIYIYIYILHICPLLIPLAFSYGAHEDARNPTLGTQRYVENVRRPGVPYWFPWLSLIVFHELSRNPILGTQRFTRTEITRTEKIHSLYICIYICVCS